MIGPSSGSDDGIEGIPEDDNLRGCTKRRALEELDIESICDEVCGHNHHRQPAKKSRFLDELQGSPAIQHQDNMIYLPIDEQHLQRDGLDGPMTRLEVLVVDGTWDDAFDSFETGELWLCTNIICRSFGARLFFW
jgi:hypothetical protein